MGFEYCYWPDVPKFLQALNRFGGPTGFLRAFARAPRKSHEMVTALNILAMAACYSPNPRQGPLGIDWPVDLESGAPRPEVWARWLARDPLRLAPRHAARLRRLRLLFLDCGRRDEFNLQWSARQMAGLLGRLRVRHVYEEFEDGHMDIAYRFDRSLPMLWEAVRPTGGSRRRGRAPAQVRRGG